MAQKTSGYADLGNGKLYYEMAGEGETLVFVHAGFVDSRMWDEQWDEFTKYYRVIRFDMRGYGKSDIAESPINRREDLYRLLHQLHIERAALVGCSSGGEIVMDFALDCPDRVSSLIIVSAVPSGFEMHGAPPQELLDMMEAAQQGDLAHTSELQLRLWVDGPHRQPEQVNSLIRQRAAEMNKIVVENGTFAIDMQPLNPLNPPAAARLDELNVPTLIITGALDNAEILRAGDVMAAEIKNAEKVVIPNAAHLPNMDQPEIFNQTVLQFIAGSNL